MNDSFIKTSFSYMKDLKKLKSEKFYIDNIEAKQMFLETCNYSDYKKAINELILEISDYIGDFEKKFTDTAKIHKKEYKEFTTMKNRIVDATKFNEPLTWDVIYNVVHKSYKKLAEKCLSDEVYSSQTIVNIRL